MKTSRASEPGSALGVEALWPLLLRIARERRAGAAAPSFDAPSPLSWDTTHGLALRGAWDTEAIELFALFKPLLDQSPPHANGAPWTIGQLGQSLDGCIATHGGDANYVNGPEMLVHLHRLRALSDAIIIGAGTAAIDDPQLTTRRVEGAHPVRVLLDPGLRLPSTLRALRDQQAPTLLACDASRAAEAARRVGREQVLEVAGLVDAENRLRLPLLQAALLERGLRVLFVEGGGITVSRFLAQGCLDRLHLSIAPLIIGGGRPGLQLPRSAAMRDCLRPTGRVFRMGVDVLWDLDLRRAD
jgi:diaminohydroxyphosphoribosylaminopyrimidine deaminase/5-amino-6-(5-phosphoribosylamino)uracil reductase